MKPAPLDENLFENELSDYCVFPIGYNQSIIYIKSDNPLTGGDRRFRYNMIPKCYGLMASEALEETGVLRVRRSPQLGYRGGGTLVAIIDTGIKLDDSLFLYEDGNSKVVSLCGIRATRVEQGRKAFFMVRNGRGKR